MRLALIALMLTCASQAGAGGCPTSFLNRGALIFNAILICVTKNVPKPKLRHAANVAAQWLDNDQNSVVDEPRLLDFLTENSPILLMPTVGLVFRSGLQSNVVWASG